MLLQNTIVDNSSQKKGQCNTTKPHNSPTHGIAILFAILICETNIPIIYNKY